MIQTLKKDSAKTSEDNAETSQQDYAETSQDNTKTSSETSHRAGTSSHVVIADDSETFSSEIEGEECFWV